MAKKQEDPKDARIATDRASYARTRKFQAQLGKRLFMALNQKADFYGVPTSEVGKRAIEFWLNCCEQKQQGFAVGGYDPKSEFFVAFDVPYQSLAEKGAVSGKIPRSVS